MRGKIGKTREKREQERCDGGVRKKKKKERQKNRARVRELEGVLDGWKTEGFERVETEKG